MTHRLDRVRSRLQHGRTRVRELRSAMSGQGPSPDVPNAVGNQLLLSTKQRQGAVYRAFACVLALNNAEDLGRRPVRIGDLPGPQARGAAPISVCFSARYTVWRVTPKSAAISATVQSRRSYASRTSLICRAESFGFCPPVRPRALAAARPSIVGSRISAWSNSPLAPMI